MYSFEQFGILIEFDGEGGKELVLGQQWECLLWISEDDGEGEDKLIFKLWWRSDGESDVLDAG